MANIQINTKRDSIEKKNRGQIDRDNRTAIAVAMFRGISMRRSMINKANSR